MAVSQVLTWPNAEDEAKHLCRLVLVDGIQVVRVGRESTVLDLDEYVEAVAVGVLDTEAAERALATSYRVLGALTAHRHDLHACLATLGITLTWRRR